MSLHLTLLVFSLGIAWSRLYYPNGPTLVSRVSFEISDKPWMPPGIDAVPIVGEHFFGDLQLPLAWARYPNPWQEDLEWKANFLPLGKWILIPFSYLPLTLAFGIYFIGSLLLLYISARKLLLHISDSKLLTDWKVSLILFLVLLVLSRPVLTDLDRGNFYCLAISLWILAFICLREGRDTQFILLMLCLTSLKWFLILPMIPFLFERKFNLSLKLTFWLIILNVFSLILVPGRLFENLRLIINTQLNYTDEWAIPWLMQGTSVASSISRIYEYVYGTVNTEIFLLNNLNLLKFLSLIYLLIAIYIAFRKHLPLWVRLYFALSTITFDTFETGWYAQMWISFVLIVWLVQDEKVAKGYKYVEWSLKISSICMLVPLWVSIPLNGNERLNSQLLFPPVVALLAGIQLIVQSRNFIRNRNDKNV